MLCAGMTQTFGNIAKEQAINYSFAVQRIRQNEDEN
jgi:hypothetical protein